MILNLDAHPQTPGEEFAGSTPEEHLELFHRYAPDLRINYFLVDPSVVRNRTSLESLAHEYGGELVIGDIRKAPGSVHHNEKKLASQLSHIFTQSLIG